MIKGERDMEQMHPLISEAIRDGGQFVLTPKGVSMLPTIVPIKDKLVLVEAEGLEKNDIVLYKRMSGTYVAHRIIKIQNGHYTMCGDNQTELEKGILPEQIIALVSEIRKADGTVLDLQDIRNRQRMFRLTCKRRCKALVLRVKKMLYPFYKAVFKRNKQ